LFGLRSIIVDWAFLGFVFIILCEFGGFGGELGCFGLRLVLAIRYLVES
jgi:hypothetical protein